MSIVPEIQEFRKRVNSISKRRDATLIKLKYLTASRASEIVTAKTPSDKTTKAYGSFLKWRLEDYEGEKVLVLKMAVAKRKKQELVFKNIGLPCNKRYEPWTIDLLKFIRETGGVHFNLTRRRVRQIVKAYFPERIGEEQIKNILRHFRFTHLSDYYGFNAEEIITYAGWTFRGQYRSGQLDTYLHLDWRKYFPKLLKVMK